MSTMRESRLRTIMDSSEISMIQDNTRTFIGNPLSQIIVAISVEGGQWTARAVEWKGTSYQTVLAVTASSRQVAVQKLLVTSGKAVNNFFEENGSSGKVPYLASWPESDGDSDGDGFVTVTVKRTPRRTPPSQRAVPPRPPPGPSPSSPKRAVPASSQRRESTAHTVAPCRRGHEVLCFHTQVEGFGEFKFVERTKPTRTSIRNRVLATTHAHFPGALEDAEGNPTGEFLVSIKSVQLRGEEFELGNLGEDLSALVEGQHIPRFLITVEKIPQQRDDECQDQDQDQDQGGGGEGDEQEK